VLKQANGVCEVCGEPAKLVHHIDGLKDNHDISNLSALCFKCHFAVHHEDGETNKKTSKYIREFGFTLREIRKKLGVSFPTICKWAKDKQKKEWMKRELENCLQG